MIFLEFLALKDKGKDMGFRYAWNGLKVVIQRERNFKIHLLAAIFVVIISFILKLSLIQWSIIILVIGLVLVSEMFNSAIELLIDYIKPEVNSNAKMIKDMAAGGVLVAAFISIIIASLVLLPEILNRFF